jgi:hypothetical protein
MIRKQAICNVKIRNTQELNFWTSNAGEVGSIPDKNIFLLKKFFSYSCDFFIFQIACYEIRQWWVEKNKNNKRKSKRV